MTTEADPPPTPPSHFLLPFPHGHFPISSFCPSPTTSSHPYRLPSPPRPLPYPYGPLVHFLRPVGRSPLHHHHQPPPPVLPPRYSVDFLRNRPLPQPVPLRPRPPPSATPLACAPSLPFPPTLAPPSSTRRSSPLFIQRDPHGHIPPAYGACGPSLDCRYHSEGPGATHQSPLSIGRLLPIHHAGRDHLHPPGPRPNPEPAQTPDPPDPP